MRNMLYDKHNCRNWPQTAAEGGRRLAGNESKEEVDMELFYELFGNLTNFTWRQGAMIAIGAVLIFLAIRKNMEPTLLLPMGFGAILVNLPFANTEALATLFHAGIASELFPLLLLSALGR